MKPTRIIAFCSMAVTWFAAHPVSAVNFSTIATNGSGVYAINDIGHVAYKGTDAADFQVYLYKDGAATKISANNNSHKCFIDYVKINNSDQVVWTQYDYSVTPLQVRLNLYKNGTITRLDTSMGSSSNYCITPQISDNGQVVWQQYTTDDGINNGAEIFLYNGKTVRITTDLNKDEGPVISRSGTVAWTGDRRALDDWDQRIFVYDGAVSVASYGAGSSSRSPQIGTDNSMAFVRYASSKLSLCILSAGQTKVIADINTAMFPFCFCGGKALFSNKASTTDNVLRMYLYNGTDTVRVSVSETENSMPSLNSAGHGAWFEADANNDYARVVYYNGATVTPINSYGAYGNPLINDLDDIVWSNDGQTIYLAHASTPVKHPGASVEKAGQTAVNRVFDIQGRSHSSKLTERHSFATGVYFALRANTLRRMIVTR
jgi:hypothetical protein